MKTLHCITVTSTALRLIRRFDGDVVNGEAIICNYVGEEPSKDRNGNVVEGAFKIFFSNAQSICYTLSGEISLIP